MHPRKRRCKSGDDICKRGVDSRASRDDDVVVTRLDESALMQLRGGLGKGGFQTPPDAVALDRIAGFLGDGVAKARLLRFARGIRATGRERRATAFDGLQREKRRRIAPTLGDIDEFGPRLEAFDREAFGHFGERQVRLSGSSETKSARTDQSIKRKAWRGPWRGDWR